MDAIVLYPEIGTRDDAANKDGSLHAKMKNLKDYMFDLMSLPITYKEAARLSFETSTKTHVMTVNGKGFIKYFSSEVNYSHHARVMLEVDGVAIDGFGDSYPSYGTGKRYSDGTGRIGGGPIFLNIGFRQQFKATFYYKSESGSGSVMKVGAYYSLVD